MRPLVRHAITAASTVAGVGAGCVAYGTVVESRWFAVRRNDVHVLPAGQRPLRVLHISDIHATPWDRLRLRFLASLAELDPDLVISTGDHHALPSADAPLLEALEGLLEIPGFFVYGSNDYTQPHFRNPLEYLTGNKTYRPTPEHAHEDLREALEEGGWRFLHNRRASLTVRDSVVELRGTGDAHIKLDRYADVAGPPSPGTDVSLGVTHAPYMHVLDAMAHDDVDLLFAGHTHGGQVCVPGYGALVSNCDLPPSMAKGLHQWQGMALHVSAGMGMSPFAPFRFACRPEATLITLWPRG